VGRPIYQAYIGSSANPGYRDFAVAAEIIRGVQVAPRVSFDVNPTSRELLENLIRDGYLQTLVHAGARIHQAGCNGCIGMGQAPATGKLSLRTVPRNFPGRSGTRDDQVCLVSPETAAASARTGVITDPRTLEIPWPNITEPQRPVVNTEMFVSPLPADAASKVELFRGENIQPIPPLEPLPDTLEVVVLLKVGDHVSTDEILPAGARVLPYRSNIPAISQFAFAQIDSSYPTRAKEAVTKDGHAVVAGKNYGQGSSREHAALAPRYLGLRLVIAQSFARIHWQNLVNFGVLPLVPTDESVCDRIEPDNVLHIDRIHEQMARSDLFVVENRTRHERFEAQHQLSRRQQEILLAGGLTGWVKQRQAAGV
jgi:aconitate hydratase